MKKTILNLTAIAFVSLLLTNCGGNSIESDAKKYAELMCKAQKMATTGDVAQSTQLATEAASLATEMQGKYKDASDMESFQAAYLYAFSDCK